MTWSSTAPNGALSVKANRSILQGNTTYTESTLGNQVVGTNTTPQTAQDHFWDVDASLDGRHRMINMPKFTVGGNLANPVRASGCDGVMYLREVNSDVARIEGFYQNADNTYQFIPSFLSGTHVVTGSYTNMVTVPKNVYGEIFMFRASTAGNETMSYGFFKTDDTTCDAWVVAQGNQGGAPTVSNLKFGNGSDASGLEIRVRAEEASNGNTWTYRVTYRAI